MFCGLRGVSVDNELRFRMICPDQGEKYWHRSIYGKFKGKQGWKEDFHEDPKDCELHEEMEEVQAQKAKEFHDDPRERELREELDLMDQLWRERNGDWWWLGSPPYTTASYRRI